MVWVVEEHLNCSTRPAAWTLCTFDVINGSVLAGMGAVGVVLNLLVLYILLVARVKIGGKQRYFLANLIIADLFLAVCAWFRGSGSIGEWFFVGGYKLTPWCVVFTLILNVSCFVNNVALVPITLERYLAVCWPFIHRSVMTKRNCIAMCVLTWVPNAVFLVIEVIAYLIPGSLSMRWNANYHRCTYLNFDWEVLAKEIVCFLIPLVIIVFCYGSIIRVLVKNNMKTKRVLLTTVLIVTTGILSWLPTVIIGIGSIKLNYQVAHIITMTFWYWSTIIDPVIYIFGFPSVQLYIKEMLTCSPHAHNAEDSFKSFQSRTVRVRGRNSVVMVRSMTDKEMSSAVSNAMESVAERPSSMAIEE